MSSHYLPTILVSSDAELRLLPPPATTMHGAASFGFWMGAQGLMRKGLSFEDGRQGKWPKTAASWLLWRCAVCSHLHAKTLYRAERTRRLILHKTEQACAKLYKVSHERHQGLLERGPRTQRRSALRSATAARGIASRTGFAGLLRHLKLQNGCKWSILVNLLLSFSLCCKHGLSRNTASPCTPTNS